MKNKEKDTFNVTAIAKAMASKIAISFNIFNVYEFVLLLYVMAVMELEHIIHWLISHGSYLEIILEVIQRLSHFEA